MAAAASALEAMMAFSFLANAWSMVNSFFLQEANGVMYSYTSEEASYPRLFPLEMGSDSTVVTS